MKLLAWLIGPLATLCLATPSLAVLLGRAETSDRRTVFTVATLDQEPADAKANAAESKPSSSSASPSPAPAAKPSAHSAGSHIPGKESALPTNQARLKDAILNRIITLTVQAQPLAGGEPTSPQRAVNLTAIDARMPAHNHGMNFTPKVSPLGKDQWKVEGFKLHMAGHWVVTLTTEIDGKQEVVSLDVDI